MENSHGIVSMSWIHAICALVNVFSLAALYVFLDDMMDAYNRGHYYEVVLWCAAFLANVILLLMNGYLAVF